VWWHAEAFRFLKVQSRSISLLDYKAEKNLWTKYPRGALLCATGEIAAGKGTAETDSPNKTTENCPF
jgi:hypothetical protein